jgi:chromosome segregation ATPase
LAREQLLESDILSLKGKLAQSNGEVAALQEKLSRQQVLLNEITSQLQDAQSDLVLAGERDERSEKQSKLATDKIQKLESEVRSLQDKLSRTEAQLEITQDDLSELQDADQVFLVCTDLPTLQNLKSINLLFIIHNHQSMSAELAAAQQIISENQTRIEEGNVQIAALNSRIAQMQKAVEESQQSNDELRLQLHSLSTERDQLLDKHSEVIFQV